MSIELLALQHLCLINKTSSVLKADINLCDKTLSEFIIALAIEKNSQLIFKKDLKEYGAEMSDILIEKLWSVTKNMMITFKQRVYEKTFIEKRELSKINPSKLEIEYMIHAYKLKIYIE